MNIYPDQKLRIYIYFHFILVVQITSIAALAFSMVLRKIAYESSEFARYLEKLYSDIIFSNAFMGNANSSSFDLDKVAFVVVLHFGRRCIQRNRYHTHNSHYTIAHRLYSHSYSTLYTHAFGFGTPCMIHSHYFIASVGMHFKSGYGIWANFCVFFSHQEGNLSFLVSILQIFLCH